MNWLEKEDTAPWGLATPLMGLDRRTPQGGSGTPSSLTHHEGNDRQT